jgi:seryl-tRNA(Sec) selenium transferase
VPIIGRIEDDRLLLDLRCLEDGNEFLEQISKLSRPTP